MPHPWQRCRPDPSGHDRWLRTTKVAFRNHHGAVAVLVGIGVDITEARLIAREPRESEQRCRDIAEVSADVIWETDAETVARLGLAPPAGLGPPTTAVELPVPVGGKPQKIYY